MSEIPHDWRLYRADDTKHVTEKFAKQVKLEKLYTYYVFDANRHVYCCSLLPSYEMFPVYIEAVCADDATEAQRESAEDELCLLSSEESVSYFDTFDADKSPNVRKAVELDACDYEDESDEQRRYLKMVDAFVEHYQGNCPSW